MTVTYKEYTNRKHQFLDSIEDWETYTSPMDRYGRYHKEYVGSKGTWYEVKTPVEETVDTEVEVHGLMVKVQQTVKFLKTEFWSTKDSSSKYYYEKW